MLGHRNIHLYMKFDYTCIYAVTWLHTFYMEYITN